MLLSVSIVILIWIWDFSLSFFQLPCFALCWALGVKIKSVLDNVITMWSPCGSEMTINRAYDLLKSARDLNICDTMINECQKRSSFLCCFSFQDIGDVLLFY